MSSCVFNTRTAKSHTHTQHTHSSVEKNLTHTHTAAAAAAVCQETSSSFIQFLFFFNSFYLIFSFFAPHTHTQHTTTGMGRLHDPKVLSRMNFFFSFAGAANGRVLCVYTSAGFLFLFFSPSRDRKFFPFFSLSSCCLAPPPPHEVAMPRLPRHLAANSRLDRPRPLKSHPPFLWIEPHGRIWIKRQSKWKNMWRKTEILQPQKVEENNAVR